LTLDTLTIDTQWTKNYSHCHSH